MRRLVVPLILVALAIALLFVLRERKRQFVAAQVQLLQSDDPQIATQARQRLQRIGRSAVRPVCALLEHEDEDVRARAALSLANIGNPAACGPLMEAAKRGDFAAADALAFMKHPRAAEARAWAWSRLGDKVLEELALRLPVGGRQPTEPCIDWWEWRRRPFVPMPHTATNWPRGPYGMGWSWQWLDAGALAVKGYETPVAADSCYDQALRCFPLAGAYIGRGRLRELCGDYAGGAELYGEALRLAPESQPVHRAKARADGLAALARQMEELLPRRFRIHRILTHPQWRRADAAYYVGVTKWADDRFPLLGDASEFVLFRRQGDRLAKLSQGPDVGAWQRRLSGVCIPMYAALVVPQPGAPPAAVLISRLYARRVYPHRVSMYRLANETLIKTLELTSMAMPWVGDLDDDGDAEIITWRPASLEPFVWAAVPWPMVHTLVDGAYQVRTEQFPSLFPEVARTLAAAEGRYPPDAKLPDHLGRAYEILGQRDAALAAYRRAEGKYVATADRMQSKGHTRQARLHRQAAATVRGRRLRLEAAQRDE
jgi:tetratricopeptide (TPR) repeat protein